MATARHRRQPSRPATAGNPGRHRNLRGLRCARAGAHRARSRGRCRRSARCSAGPGTLGRACRQRTPQQIGTGPAIAVWALRPSAAPASRGRVAGSGYLGHQEHQRGGLTRAPPTLSSHGCRQHTAEPPTRAPGRIFGGAQTPPRTSGAPCSAPQHRREAPRPVSERVRPGTCPQRTKRLGQAGQGASSRSKYGRTRSPRQLAVLLLLPSRR